MHNNLFTIGSFTIHGYGLMIALGFIAALFMSRLISNQHGLDNGKVLDIFFNSLIWGFVGAKLLYCITVFKDFIKQPFYYLFSSGGLVVYGGIIIAIVANIIFCYREDLDFFEYANCLIPLVSLGQMFGRIGCLLAGCCYGKETTSSFAITFTHSDFAPNNVALYPTQLMFAFGNAILFMILYYNLQKGKHKEFNIGIYCIGYGVGRFVLEYFRGDDARGFIGDISTSQLISIFFVLIGVSYFALLRYMNTDDYKNKMALITAMANAKLSEKEKQIDTKKLGKLIEKNEKAARK